jgi:hypothetical protein
MTAASRPRAYKCAGSDRPNPIGGGTPGTQNIVPAGLLVTVNQGATGVVYSQKPMAKSADFEYQVKALTARRRMLFG